MTRNILTLITLLGLAAAPALATAQEATQETAEDNEGVTMQLMERDGDPGEVARSLELPEGAADRARQATDGAGPADPARERMREERGDMGEAMKEMRQERQRMREARDEMDRQRPENAGPTEGSGDMRPNKPNAGQ